MKKLALFGGEPTIAPPLVAEWPPVDEGTAKKLLDLYYSRRWTAFDDTEKAFAAAFAAHHDTGFGIFTINGTVTLQCALGAYDIGPGDEVIVPALTWYATAMAVRFVGATPVFVDIDPNTLCIDPEQIEAAITDRTRAVIPVHLYGSMADMDRIMEIARRHGLRVIEDCAHMHGGVWAGRHVGSIGDAGSFSFQHSKTMGCADAGICITNDAAAADRMFRMKQIGYAPGEGSRNVRTGPPPGLQCHNFRATAFPAVILQDQLPTLDSRLDQYGRATRYLEDRLRQTTKIRFQAPGRRATRQGYFGWVMLFDDPEYADIPLPIIRDALVAEGVDVIKTWGAVFRFVLWNLSPDEYRIHEDCRVTDAVGGRLLWMLHAYLMLEMRDIERIAEAIEKVMGNVGDLRNR